MMRTIKYEYILVFKNCTYDLLRNFFPFFQHVELNYFLICECESSIVSTFLFHRALILISIFCTKPFSELVALIAPSAFAVQAETLANNGTTTTPSPPPDAPLRSDDQDVTGEEGESNLCQNPQKCQCECPLADDARAATSEAAPTESPLESSTSSRASPTFFGEFSSLLCLSLRQSRYLHFALFYCKSGNFVYVFLIVALRLHI